MKSSHLSSLFSHTSFTLHFLTISTTHLLVWLLVCVFHPDYLFRFQNNFLFSLSFFSFFLFLTFTSFINNFPNSIANNNYSIASSFLVSFKYHQPGTEDNVSWFSNHTAFGIFNARFRRVKITLKPDFEDIQFQWRITEKYTGSSLEVWVHPHLEASIFNQNYRAKMCVLERREKGARWRKILGSFVFFLDRNEGRKPGREKKGERSDHRLNELLLLDQSSFLLSSGIHGKKKRGERWRRMRKGTMGMCSLLWSEERREKKGQRRWE